MRHNFPPFLNLYVLTNIIFEQMCVKSFQINAVTLLTKKYNGQKHSGFIAKQRLVIVSTFALFTLR